jgi:glycosyltransferase involved in cell wall biosynthesis
MRTRVLILPSWYPSGGSPITGIFIEDQAVVLSRAMDVTVHVPRMWRWRDYLAAFKEGGPGYEDPAGLRVYRQRVPIPPKISLGASMALYLRGARRGFRRVAERWGRPDVIHAHVVLPAGWAAMRLGREHGIPVVLTEHSGPFAVHLVSDAHTRLVRETLQGVSALIAVSPAMARQLQAACPGVEIQVLGNVVRSDVFRPPEEAADSRRAPPGRFLSVSGLVKEKGIEYLLEAAHRLRRAGAPDFEVVIAGDGPDRARLERRAAELGLGGSCRFLGALSRKGVRDALRDCSVFVLPSLGETFGVVLAEAMACGKPVIATRCGGPEFVVPPGSGTLVPPGDPAALADAMAASLAACVPPDGDRIRREVIQRFGPEVFLARMTAILDRVSRRAGARPPAGCQRLDRAGTGPR